jgi:hypothetical protein
VEPKWPRDEDAVEMHIIMFVAIGKTMFVVTCNCWQQPLEGVFWMRFSKKLRYGSLAQVYFEVVWVSK